MKRTNSPRRLSGCRKTESFPHPAQSRGCGKDSSAQRTSEAQAVSQGCKTHDSGSGGEASPLACVLSPGVGRSAAVKPAAISPYLEEKQITVTHPHERVNERLILKSCGCHSRFCQRCCVPLGTALRHKMRDVLGTFNSVYMVTLTIDPALFSNAPSPYQNLCPAEAAYRYCRDERCIARFVRDLKSQGMLNSARYFYVVEWQERTEFPHFHLVLDATFIQFDALCAAWNRFRPQWAAEVLGKRPGFGSVKFTASKFNRSCDADGCAGYVAKYLTKHPKQGYPEWVMSATYRIRRYSTSRGFWGEHGRKGRTVADVSGDIQATAADSSGTAQKSAVTIQERVARCGEACAVFEVAELANLHTGQLVKRYDFVARIPMPLPDIIQRIGKCPAEGRYGVVINNEAMNRLDALLHCCSA